MTARQRVMNALIASGCDETAAAVATAAFAEWLAWHEQELRLEGRDADADGCGRLALEVAA